MSAEKSSFYVADTGNTVYRVMQRTEGLEKAPAKRIPASVFQRQIEQVRVIPRTKQKFVTERLDAVIKQRSASG